MGLKSEASQPLNTRKLINVIILGPRKIKRYGKLYIKNEEVGACADITTMKHSLYLRQFLHMFLEPITISFATL